MATWRSVLAGIAAALMILSSGAHTFMGWSALRAELAPTGASTDLQQALGFGWRFGGVAMIAFGLIVLSTLAGLRREPRTTRQPLLVVALAYAGFGTWAFVSSGLDPFFLVFVVPGAMLLPAALAPVSR